MRARYIIYTWIIFCLISSGACKKGAPTSTDTSTDSPTLGVGDTAPNFTGVDQHDQYVNLYDYSGKVVLFEFSGDNCIFCEQEAPVLEELYNEYKDRGFQVITLLVSGNNKTWAQKYNLTFPVLDDTTKRVYYKYETGGIPLNIVVDRNFVIRYKRAGFHEDQIRPIIEQYL